MLAVLFILAGAVVPIVYESVDTARMVSAMSDARLIAAGLVEFQRDLGTAALSRHSAGQRAHDVLATAGEMPSVDESSTEPVDFRGPFVLERPRPPGGRESRRQWLEGRVESIDDHLLTNRAQYVLSASLEEGGWRGPYLSRSVKKDPWGQRYLINCRWLIDGVAATDGAGSVKRAVFVLSAGPNGIIETPFDQPISDAAIMGDDVGVRIQ